MIDSTIAQLEPALEGGDTIIDGGDSYYVDDLRARMSWHRKASIM